MEIPFDVSTLKEAPAYILMIWLVFNYQKNMSAKMDEVSQLLGRAVFVIQALEKRLNVDEKGE